MELVKITDKLLDDVVLIENESFKAPFKKENFEYELKENPFSKFYGVTEDNKLVGYIIFWITFNTSTLCKIAVQKSKRNRGFAGFLMKNMEKMLLENEVESMTLEVRKSNESAINLYKKFGFKEITIKPKYYDDGEDAIYMGKLYL